MKKTINFFILFILLMNISKAQNASFGFCAGATFASYKATVEDLSLTSKTKAGFTVGFTSSIPIGKYFSFQPGLNYLQKGGTFKDQGATDKTTLNYIELPLNFVFNTNSANGKFFAGAGPSFSMGLSGKDKWDDGGYSGEEDIKFGSSDEDDLKPFEAGVNFLAGYQFPFGLFVAGNYNLAVSNISNDDPMFNTKYHNRYFGIRIGYMFGGNKK